MEVILRVDECVGPMFLWEVPLTFDLWFQRASGGYLQLLGRWPGGEEMCIVDVMIDRDMWE